MSDESFKEDWRDEVLGKRNRVLKSYKEETIRAVTEFNFVIGHLYNPAMPWEENFPKYLLSCYMFHGSQVVHGTQEDAEALLEYVIKEDDEERPQDKEEWKIYKIDINI